VREPYAPVDRLRFERLSMSQDVDAVAPTLRSVAQARGTGHIRVTYLDGGTVDLTCARQEHIHRLDFTPDSRYLMVNRNQACHIESGDWVQFPETGHTNTSHAFLQGDRVALAQGSGQVEVIDLENGERLQPICPVPEAVGRRVYMAVASSSDLTRLGITLDNSLHLYDADSERWDGSWQLDEPLIGLAFSPGGRWLTLLAIQSGHIKRGSDLIKTGRPAKILFWDRVTRRIAARTDCERQFCFSPVHPLMVVGTQEGLVEVLAMDWSLLREGQAEFTSIERIQEDGPVQRLEFIAHGNFLAVTTRSGVGLWKVVLPESTRFLEEGT
jgi:hypothetical protein